MTESRLRPDRPILAVLLFLLTISSHAVFASVDGCRTGITIPSPGGVNTLFFGEIVASSGPHVVVTSRNPAGVHQFDLITGQLVRELEPPEEPECILEGIAITRGNRAVLGATQSQPGPDMMVVYDLETGQPLNNLYPPGGHTLYSFYTPTFIDDDRLLVGASIQSGGGTTVLEYNLNTGAILRSWPDPSATLGAPRSIAVADTFIIVGRGFDSRHAFHAGAVDIYGLQGGQLIRSLAPQEIEEGAGFGLEVVANDQFIAVARKPHPDEVSGPGLSLVEIFDGQTGQRLDVIEMVRPCRAYPPAAPHLAIQDNLLVMGVDQGSNTYPDCPVSGLVFLYDLDTGILDGPITTPIPQNLDAFGWDVALNGSKLLVGAPYSVPNGTSNGRIYVLDLAPGYESIHPLLPGTQDQFARTVALDGGLAVIGTAGDDDMGLASGSASIFDTRAGFQHILYSPSPDNSDQFGSAVAIDGAVVAVGSIFDNSAVYQGGAVFLFDALTGQATHTLLANDAEISDRMGAAVAVSGDLVVAGVEFDADLGTNAGAAYIFSAGTGAQLRKLVAGDGAPGDRFGVSVAVDAGRVLVGAPACDAVAFNSGAAYVFDAATGQQLYRLVPDDAGYGDLFGHSVAISGDLALVGALEFDGAQINCGAAYVFDLTTGQQIQQLRPDVDNYFGYFGRSVALDGDRAVVGAAHANETRGAAYTFDAYTGQLLGILEPEEGLEVDDYFGWSVAVSGCTALVGAPQTDAPLVDGGMAYFFDLASSPVSAVEGGVPAPLSLLAPPHPNPFNPQTTLRFELPRAGKTELAIFDMAGRKVATVLEAELAAGAHEIVWRGRDALGRSVGSGTYLVRLVTPQGVASRKLTMLK